MTPAAKLSTPPKPTPWKSSTHASHNRPATNTPWLTSPAETIAVPPTAPSVSPPPAKPSTSKPAKATTRHLRQIFRRRELPHLILGWGSLLSDKTQREFDKHHGAWKF